MAVVSFLSLSVAVNEPPPDGAVKVPLTKLNLYEKKNNTFNTYPSHVH